MDTFTPVRAQRPLTKHWLSNCGISSAADQKWFEAKEHFTGSLSDPYEIISAVAKLPRVALVKDAITSHANRLRLRRKTQAGFDDFTGEWFPAGLKVVPRKWTVLDVEKLSLPPSIGFDDGGKQAEYVRSLLPREFKVAACVWQMSASACHLTRRREIRLHLFFMLDSVVYPAAFKRYLAKLTFLDGGIFETSRLIFTADPVVHDGLDPIERRHRLLAGKPSVKVTTAVPDASKQIGQGDVPPVRLEALAPVPAASDAAEFVDLVAASGVLRSGDPAYQFDRARRLAFCSLLKTNFGITDEETLEDAFRDACVGPADPSGEHDVREALAWARTPSPNGRQYEPRKLMREDSAALRTAGDLKPARSAARLAMTLSRRGLSSTKKT